ncbi:TPA: DUF2977 domain-containing protein [Streptococcus equi subsp. zooepidemicus]|nr:DUF2977 domain-containing protein [Streptococcus equi subsp. zooepidemicus]HEL1236296.1 DUF2977 domain-containing protein [Streptococcus equi subsp. zooepidemicus]
MQILCNKKGYVTSYALVGTLVNGVEINVPEDADHFCEHFQCYRLKAGILEYDAEQEAALADAEELDKIRLQRNRECFSVINRGQLWYDKLTDKQREELQQWYDDWLNATSTKKIPSKPSWLKD